MKVLFIYTDVDIAVGYSCGIGALSAYLKQHGHQTKLIHVSDELNYPLDLNRIVKDVLQYDPGLVAFSTVTNQWLYIRRIAEAIRKACAIPILAGGHHVNAAVEQVLADEAFDFACKGEGEVPLLELANRLEAGESIADVPNIMYRKNCRFLDPGRDTGPEGSGETSELAGNPMVSWPENLDELPFEDRELFDYPAIVDSRHGWAEVIATRGCPYACTYCFNLPFFNQYKQDLAEHNQKVTIRDYVRRRSVGSTIAMLKNVKDNYPNVKYVTFVDDVFAVDADWLAELLGPYRDEIGLPFSCTSQPLAFNEEIARTLKQMGCKVVKMGIESGNQHIRKQVLGRNISDQVLVRSFELARKYNLKPQAFNMIGLPTETPENMLETVRLNAELRPYIAWLSTFMPYPGTSLYEFCKKNDLIDESRWDNIFSYRQGSVLKEKSFTYLDLEKIRLLFKWQLNAALRNQCSLEYCRNIDELAHLSPDSWFGGQAEEIYKTRDAELDEKYRQEGVDHYITKKYVNMFWAREYDYDLT